MVSDEKIMAFNEEKRKGSLTPRNHERHTLKKQQEPGNKIGRDILVLDSIYDKKRKPKKNVTEDQLFIPCIY